MPEGETILGSLKDGQRVIIEDGVAKLPDRSAFAGSVATADRLVRTIVFTGRGAACGCGEDDDADARTDYEGRRLQRFARRGQGCRYRDFDEEINVKTTIIGGKCLTIH